MEQEVILCGTDVIIELYRNNQEIISELHKIEKKHIGISIITAGELIFGALNKRELHQIQKDIKSLKSIYLNNDVGEIFLKLMSKYSLSHGLKIPDALIASTAIAYQLELFTLNTKDFRFIKELELYHYRKNEQL